MESGGKKFSFSPVDVLSTCIFSFVNDGHLIEHVDHHVRQKYDVV